jgi:hypothetical protein
MVRMALMVLALAASATVEPQTRPAQTPPTAGHVTVYRKATCGCCGKWVDHLKAAGFEVTVHVVDNVDTTPGRDRVPASLRSCHTGTVGRYAIEGHIPADVVKDLLKKRPDVDGIAVPGMPAGSPGMESPNPVKYEVIAFDKQGRTSTFAWR